VTEVGGRIVDVFVNEGKVVSKGQPLARTDDVDLQQALRVAEQEKAKFEAEADRLQVLADDGGRRIAMLQAAQVQRQIEQLQRKLARTSITSPIDGVVMTKDLPSHTGELLPLGGRFCEIADLSRWEVVVHLSESDVGLVDDKLRRGQRPIAQFLLRSMPNRKLTATVSDMKAISQMSYQIPRANVFLVRADVVASPELRAALKTGYTGQCKIALGWRPLGYLVPRRFFDYIRVHWLF
jgi:multidrug efflux pump subunit AcrA (membrane-fusion protein)